MNSLALETSLNERGFFESSWFNFNELNFKFSFYRYGSCDWNYCLLVIVTV